MKRYVFKTLDSTNDEAKRIIRRGDICDNGEGKNFLIISAAQSAGRGQHGRRFFSPEGGLYMSVGIELAGQTGNSFITQSIAVAAARSIEDLYGVRLTIKPVNDLFFNRKKTGGILVETDVHYGAEKCFAVAGIGINLCRPSGGFPQDIACIAGYVLEEKICTFDEIISLAEDIAQRIISFCGNFGEESIISDYLARTSEYERSLAVLPVGGV